MGRIVQFCGWTVLAGFVVYAILAAADAAMIIGASGTSAQRCVYQFPKWLGCVAANHENLAGGLFGGVGTILAGLIAWWAVQEQINDNNILRREAFEAIGTDLRDVLELWNQVWRAVDHALAEGAVGDVLIDRMTVATIVCSTQEIAFDVLTSMANDLAPARKRLFRRIEAALRIANEEIIRAGKLNANDPMTRHRLTVVRISLSHVEKYLRQFDPMLASIFDGRVKAPVNHLNMGDLIRPFVDEHVPH